MLQSETPNWLENAAPIIKKLAAQYPIGQYRIKAGAPYKLTCPGSKISVNGWRINGLIDVILMVSDKLPATIAHEKKLCENNSELNYEALSKSNIRVDINPIWLEPIM